MKKLLEVSQYGDLDIRFDTDVDIEKNPQQGFELSASAAIAMATKLWGGNERSVIAVIRSLAIADLAVSVNRKQMIRMLEEGADQMADFLNKMKSEAESSGIIMQVFPPGVKKPETGS